jgi:hypothetical protein
MRVGSEKRRKCRQRVEVRKRHPAPRLKAGVCAGGAEGSLLSLSFLSSRVPLWPVTYVAEEFNAQTRLVARRRLH